MEGMDSGWYDDPTGRATHQAYWNGEEWTGQTRPGKAKQHVYERYEKRSMWLRWIVSVAAATI